MARAGIAAADSDGQALCGLDEVLATPELARRPSRAPDYEREAKALAMLAGEIADHPDKVLQQLTDTIIELCIADSAGVSLLESDEGAFRWAAVSGAWAEHVEGRMPIDASPCGVVIARNEPLLFQHPHRHFSAAKVEPNIDEIMLVPFHVNGKPAGTLWAIAHRPDRKFDREDQRLLVSLARVATAAVQMLDMLARLADDLAAREQVETALRESEARFRLLGETAPIIIALADGDGKPTYVNPYWEIFSGRSAEEYLAGAYRTALHPDDRESSEAIWQKALRTGTGFEMEFRARAADGSYRWVQTRGTPVRDAAGNVVSWVNVALDIDDLRRLKDRQSHLVAELQHRVRNILTVIRSIFHRTTEMTADADEMADHFKGRLDAMARTQVLATHNAARLVDLESLIRDELLSVGVHDGPETSICGPDVALPFDMAEPVALAIHELTTNALKYGALRTSGAELDIRWEVNLNHGGQRQLDLCWAESGVPAVSVSPARKGFGRELIEEALPYRLGAKADLKFAGNGVRCSISIPLPGEGDEASRLKRIGWW